MRQRFKIEVDRSGSKEVYQIISIEDGEVVDEYGDKRRAKIALKELNEQAMDLCDLLEEQDLY